MRDSGDTLKGNRVYFRDLSASFQLTLLFPEKPCLHKVKLTTVEDDFTRWIDFVARPELEHLDFECKPVVSGTLMPLRLYTCCPKLRHLRLHGVSVGSTSLESSVSLPCLKTMRLENNTYADEACLELLISSCPVLEDFSFVRMPGSCGVNVLRVHSKTLTSLSIETGVHDYDFQNNDRISVRVLINAPRLKYLNLCDFISECKTISNLGSLTKVNLGRYCDNVPDHFFTGISEVRDMKIAGSAFRSILKIRPLPQFCNLSCLGADACFWDRDILTLLEICPNLRSLILDLSRSLFWGEQTRFTAVPRCLLSSLEFVEIASTFGGLPAEMKLVRYFAENSVVLEKLSLRLKSTMDEQDSVALRDILLALPTLSSAYFSLFET
ncbi:hypothetical protein YC2023_007545 [Brassica napus]